MPRATFVSLVLAFCTIAAAIPTGPELGSRIPDFEIRDQDGERRTFEDLRGPEGLLLLFHRSADW